MMLYKAAANLALKEAAKKALDAETKRQKDLSAIDASKGKYGGFIADILNLNKEPGVDLEEATRKDVNAAADELKKGGDVYIGIAEEFFRKVANITAKNKFNMPLSGITSTSGTNKANEKSVQSAKKTAEEKLKIEKEYVDDINALDRQVQLMNEKTDAATIARVTKVLEEKKRLNAKYAKEELDLINENLAANAVMWDNADQERLEASIKRLETFQAAAGIIQNALNNIGGIISDRANLKADQAVKEIDRVKEAELAALDKVAMSTQQKEEEKKRIETQAESRRKQIERERITALRKAAQFQKAADIASIISSTAAAIMGFQKNPGGPAGIVLSIAAGVTGGIQLARAAAAPLPQYFKGRKGGKMEFAEVNEKGPELLETKDGKFSIANGGKRGVTLLQEGEKVHTNESFMKMVSNRAHSILSTHPTPNSNSYERAYLQAINEMKDEFTGMKQMLKQKKDGFIIKGNFGHDIYVDSIRM
jgi:hypothetical protein